MKKCVSILLALLFLFPVFSFPAAFAEEAETEEEDSFTVIREGELEEIIEEYLTENGVWRNGVGIGFLYTATGEEWYYNGDKTFYSASLYKVPLVMLVSNMVARGELEQDAKIAGYDLTAMEESILVYSNNPYAHLLMDHFWRSRRECRELWPALAGMENEELPAKFYVESEFTPRFMTRVMYTLYSDPESYPLMIDFLKQATPHMYFRYELEDQYEIAEKFGYYENYRHVSGIIYTENPIIITYMSRDNGPLGRFSSDLAVRLVEYSKTLDQRLAEHEEAERLEQERLEAEAEEAARSAEEVTPAFAEEAADDFRPREEEEVEAIPAETAAASEEETGKALRKRAALVISGMIIAAAVLGSALSFIIRSFPDAKKSKQKSEATK